MDGEDLDIYFAGRAQPVVIGEAPAIDGIYTVAPADFDGPVARVLGVEEYVTVRADAVPLGTKQGDTLTVNGLARRIRALRPEPPDGALLRLELGNG